MNDPSAQQQEAYDDFFSEPNQTGGSSNCSSNHPDFSGDSFAPIGPAATPAPAPGNNAIAAGNTYGSSQNGNNGPLPWWKRIFWVLALETYQPYFNIDSDDVQYRMVSTVRNLNVDDGFWNQVLTGNPSSAAATTTPDQELPHPGQQQQSHQRQPTDTPGNKGPDAYGPFWLATTLIFLLAVTSNISNYLHRSREVDYREDFEYDIVILAHAVWVMYGYTFGVPFALAVIFRVLLTGEGGAGVASSALPSFAELMCLYGYSLVPYGVGFILCGILPFNIVQWLVLFCATGASLMFVLRNLAGRIIGKPMSSAISQFSTASSQRLPQHEDDLEGDQNVINMDFAGPASGSMDDHAAADRNAQMVHHQRAKGTPILGSVIGIHIVFCLMLKLGFYHPYATGVPTK